MSFQQDYLLRMIQDLSVFMTRIIRLRREGKTEEALEMLTDESTRVSGIPPSLVYALSDDDLISTLMARGALEPERCYAIAEIFREEGLVFEELDAPDEANVRFGKATRLYVEALRFSEADNLTIRIDGLRETLAHADTSLFAETTLDLLLGVLIEREAYDLADNTLFELLGAPDGPTIHHDRAERTYRAMLAASDYALSRSGLEREEVEDALSTVNTDLTWI